MSDRKRPAAEQDPHADLEFEDEYGDDYEEEEFVQGDDDDEECEDEPGFKDEKCYRCYLWKGYD